MKYLWKSMRRGMKSGHGKIDWKTGEWQTMKGPLRMCKNGFHASESVIDAMKYVNCEILAKVQVAGKSLTQSDKQVWEKMRIIESWTWDKRDSVKLAIFAAELVIGIYEKIYPNDNRPGNAIKAAKEYRAAETARAAAVDAAWAATEAARAAAWAAIWTSGAAARAAARAAESAGWAAAWAARAAAGAASGAARAAAWAASGAARAAAGAASGNTGAAAGAAARAALIKKCDQLVISILKEKRNNEK